MSFDIHFQRFERGDARTGGGAEAVDVLGPFLQPNTAEPRTIVHSGGTAEVYGLGSDSGSMMLTHIDGDGLWDLLVAAAQAARWAIMPVGCPTCVFSREMLADLPAGLDVDAVIITSGDELRTVVANG